ncbi:unnamed protein product [Effrenium voratum]|uniref:Uncharacterized protein n=1 Tax=Effrenium voratum TaxID=2562239 RepID=A0AA36NJ79_9DINO|nr:unnamed protein product [Effrenium voratum]CAJ1409144.1 unnamed protein product [Effrenium voratum]CAJ1432409.1 unnamed protein product [Effrenium voratum]
MSVAMANGDRDITARERGMVQNSSNVFGEGMDKSVYSAAVQKEIVKNLRETFAYVKNAPVPEAVNLPRPGELKQSLLAGNQAVLTSSPGTRGTPKSDPSFMPKEFWHTSVDLQWHDVRNERCRHKSHGMERQNLDAKGQKMREMSSELFEKGRMTTASVDRSDMLAGGTCQTDFLSMDSSLHERHMRSAPGGHSASRKVQVNLASSEHNTMPQPELAVQAEAPVSNVARASGNEMRNYSDLFGTEMGRRPNDKVPRQEVLGTKCSFLDHRNELETARTGQQRYAQADSPKMRKEAEQSAAQQPRSEAKKLAGLQQALDLERGIHDSKDGLGITAEVSRRRREKDFRKDFEGDVRHLSKKQQCLSSDQVRNNMGQGVAPEAPAPPTSRGLKLAGPHSPTKHEGLTAQKHEQMLRNAKDTKLASLQSSIFT